MRPTEVCLCYCICICVFMYFLFAYQSGHRIARAPLNTAVCGKLESKQDRIRPCWPVTRRAGTEYWYCIVSYIILQYIIFYHIHIIQYSIYSIWIIWVGYTRYKTFHQDLLFSSIFKIEIFCMRCSPLLILSI